MADVQVHRTLTIQAGNVGDVAKWLGAVQEAGGTTGLELTEPITLQVQLNEAPVTSPVALTR